MSGVLPGDSKRSLANFASKVGETVKGVFHHEDHEPLATAGSVDLARYAGLWYELARLPMRFQADITVSTAEYTAQDDGSIGVVNTAYRGSETDASIEGSAVPAEGAEESKDRLIVTFGGLLKFIPKADEGNYIVIRLAEDYSLALVGTPDRSAMWLLSRNPQGWGSSQVEEFVAFATEQGFDTDRLLVADWDSRVTRENSRQS